MGREERDRCVAPVIDPSWRTILGVELEYRQQFDGCYSKMLQVWDLFDQTLECAACLLLDAGIRVTRETSEVHFVNDSPRGSRLQRPITLPIVEARVHDDALHGHCGVVAHCGGRIAAIARGDSHPAAIWVKQDFGGIKPHPSRGIGRSMNSIS